MHPIINEFINTNDGLFSILEKYYDRNQYLETVFFKVLQAHSNYNENYDIDQQLFLEIDQAIIKGHPDGAFYYFFILHAILFDCRHHKLENANALLAISNSLPSEQFHPLLQAFFLDAKATLKFKEGKFTEALDLSKKMMSLVDKKSIKYMTYFLPFASKHSSQGRLKELDKADLDHLELPTNNKKHAEFCLMIKLENCILIGKYKEGVCLLEAWQKINSIRYTHSIQEMSNLLKILMGDFNEKNYQEDYFKFYANVYHFIILGNMGEALKYSKMIQNGKRQKVTDLYFEKYLPLHVELCLRNIGKARLIFQEIVQKNGQHYLDDIFLARIQLLEMNRDDAYKSFYRLIENINRYDAMGRLEFELQFAKEMKISDILFLMNGFKNIEGLKVLALQKQKPIIPYKVEKGIQLLIGDSQEISQVKELLIKYAKLKDPVLITGETGTGKELVSRAIHEEGPHPKEPFLAINCGALTDSLLQSELFGYVAGAFTGAQKERQGIFEAAGKGTVFLDEFGDISPKMQVSLLRVLESNEIRLIGGTNTRQIECKIIIATNIDLHQAVDEKKFREDLYFRLARFDIKLPPLRERVEDIPKLITYFLEANTNNSTKQKISTDLLRALIDYRWPGNIRELKNEIERLKILHSDKELLNLEDFDFAHLQGMNTFMPNKVKKSKEVNEKNSTSLKLFNPERILDDVVLKIVQKGSKYDQRHEFLKGLFRQYKKLTRMQVIEIMAISPVTATKDLEILCQAGFIVRRMPTKSVKSHYFVLVE